MFCFVLTQREHVLLSKSITIRCGRNQMVLMQTRVRNNVAIFIELTHHPFGEASLRRLFHKRDWFNFFLVLIWRRRWNILVPWEINWWRYAYFWHCFKGGVNARYFRLFSRLCWCTRFSAWQGQLTSYTDSIFMPRFVRFNGQISKRCLFVFNGQHRTTFIQYRAWKPLFQEVTANYSW